MKNWRDLISSWKEEFLRPLTATWGTYEYRTNYYCYLYSEIIAYNLYQVFKKSNCLINSRIRAKNLKNDLWANMDNFLQADTINLQKA